MRRLILTALLVALFAVPAAAQVVIVPAPWGTTSGKPFDPLYAKGVVVSGGTVTTTATPFLSIAGTWNDAGTTHTAFKVNVTDTNSTAASLLMDLQVGGSSKASIKKDGKIVASSWVEMPAGSGVYLTPYAFMRSPASGVVTLYNESANGFTRLNFGGTTSSFPALKVVGNALSARLADDSADTGFAASYLVTNYVKTTAAPVAENYFSVTCTGTSPARTCSLQVYDSSGLRTIATSAAF